MDVDSASHSTPHIFDGSWFTDASRVVVDEITLELLHLLICKHHLRKFTNSGIHAVHDFVGLDLFLQHGAAGFDALEGFGMKLHVFFVPCDFNQLIDSQTGTVQDDGHCALLF